MKTLSPLLTALAMASAFSTADVSAQLAPAPAEPVGPAAPLPPAAPAPAAAQAQGQVKIQIQVQGGAGAVQVQGNVNGVQIQGGVIQAAGGRNFQIFGSASGQADSGKPGEPYAGLVGTGNDLEVVNGTLVAKPSGKPAKPAQAAAVEEQMIEFTDETRLHGQLVKLGAGEVVWQRKDVMEPMAFPAGEIRRIVLGGAPAKTDVKANATLQVSGGGWLAGDLTGFENGKLQVRLGAASVMELDRAKVQWLLLSPSAPPDAYDGPQSVMGLGGWEGASGWEFRDGALFAASQGRSLTKRFDLLPEKLDLEFTIGDPKEQNAVTTVMLSSAAQPNIYSRGYVQVHFQKNSISANVFDGAASKNFNTALKPDAENPKSTRHRILLDRRSGKFIAMVNGRKVADWTLPMNKEVSPNGSIMLQPRVNRIDPTPAWNLSKIRVRPWDGNAEPDGKPEDAGKDLLSSESQGRVAGALEGVDKDVVRFGGKEFARKDPLFIRLAGNDAPNPGQPAIARVQLAQRGEFDVAGIEMHDGQIAMRTSFSGDLALPAAVVRSIEFSHRLNAAQRTAADGSARIIFKNGDELRGTIVSAGPDAVVKWKSANGGREIQFGIG